MDLKVFYKFIPKVNNFNKFIYQRNFLIFMINFLNIKLLSNVFYYYLNYFNEKYK